MKITTVLLLVTLGLVCSAYAAPIDVQDQIYTLLCPRSSAVHNYDDARAQVIPAVLLLASKLWPLIKQAAEKIKKFRSPSLQVEDDMQEQLFTFLRPRTTSVQDSDNDDVKTQLFGAWRRATPIIKTMLRPTLVQEQAETESILGKLIEATSKHAPKFLQHALKNGPKILSNKETQNDDDDDNDADTQARPYGKEVPFSGDLITELVSKLYKKVAKNNPRPSIQDEDENDDTQIEALLLQSTNDKAETKSLDGIREKLRNFVQNVRENLTRRLRTIGKVALEYQQKYGDDDTNAQIKVLLKSIEDEAETESLIDAMRGMV